MSETRHGPGSGGGGPWPEDAAASGAPPGADPGLTIPRSRLAGSSHCPNCGTALLGAYCHHCGQPDRRLCRFFPVLARELLEDVLGFDSRVLRTLRPLLLRPGHLTRDYLEGRRHRYTPPLRLYLFSSLLLFLVLAMRPADVTVRHAGGTAPAFTISTSPEGARRAREAEGEIGEALDLARRELEAAGATRGAGQDRGARDAVDAAGADAGGRARPDANANANANADAEGEDDGEGEGEGADDGEGTSGDGDDEADEVDILVNGRPWDRNTNPLTLPFTPRWVNDWINDEIEQSPAKAREIESNPQLFRDALFDVLPATLFVLLPVAALLFKLAYLLSKRYYVEHLVFALHQHAFLFVALLLYAGAGALRDWARAGGVEWAAVLLFWLRLAILLWIPVAFLLALKRVYRQGWLATLVKYGGLALSYSILIGFASAFVAVASFLLL